MRIRDGCWYESSIAPTAFLFFLFTYQGELSSFMQKSQVVFDKVL
ncbi:MAG: hypothetical protein QQW96_10795 [Tychonema bourrellyi B0820]|nr:hypothetical protein [Tychonema bourrellyi]MDQ2098124.1 hypothetical protein [Tychonema bourrellyi B0820]